MPSLPETGKNQLLKLNAGQQKICKTSFRKGTSTIPPASVYKRKSGEKERWLSAKRGSLLRLQDRLKKKLKHQGESGP